MEIINEASEKFKDKQDEICEFLFALLRQMNALEKEAFARSEELVRQKLEAGIPKYQLMPAEEELWDEYEERLGEIVRPACTEKLLKRGYALSYGNPPQYGYIDDESAATSLPRVHFQMKTAKKAVVEAHFHAGTDQMHKFVLKDAGGKWLVDEVYYGFESNPDKWHANSIR